MITQVRTARPEITIAGTDYFGKLAPYFLSLSYTDNCDGQHADDLQLHLADRDRRFISDWMPDKGTFIDVAIIAERWFSPYASPLKLDCGRFWIDEVKFELPQHTVTIKACSIPTTAHLKGAQDTRGWENQTLKKIVEQISKENKMEEPKYESSYNPTYERVEKVSQSDLAFLQERAKDSALAIKVARNQIIIFDEEDYEKKEPSFTVVYGDMAATGGACYRMSGGEFDTKLIDTLKKSTVSSLDPEWGHLINETRTANEQGDKLPEEHHAQVNEDTDTADDEEEGNGGQSRQAEPLSGWDSSGTSGGAGRKAKAVLRDANKHKRIASVELSLGNPLIASGQTMMLSGVGQFDGKWFVESIQHVVGPMFNSTLMLRRCLEGY